jgi:protein-S-isoprenylcysteine O-methyltransferase Ste14
MEESNDLDSLDHAEVAFHPPVMLVAALAVGFLLRWIWQLAFLPVTMVIIFGPLVVIAAFGIFFWAVAALRRERTSIQTGTPTDVIVTYGPYAFSRNPIYVAMLLLLVGVGIWTNSLWFLIVAIVCSQLLIRGVIEPEERYLEREFGTDYLQYCAKVRRWL